MTEVTVSKEHRQIRTPSIVSVAVKAAALQCSPAAGGQISVPVDEIYFSFLLNAAVFSQATGLIGGSDVHLNFIEM